MITPLTAHDPFSKGDRCAFEVDAFLYFKRFRIHSINVTQAVSATQLDQKRVFLNALQRL